MTRAPAEVGSAANSYEILAKLAMGGMAEIFLARGESATGVERYVVLKRVLRHRATDVHFVQMFLDEARLAAQLQHPNIAQVYDIGKLGDSYFFTMEYVHGETVRNLLARSHGLRRQIPISSVLSIIAGAAAGLQHAHDRKGFDGRHLGIVHRDVSPSNLMVSYEGTVKVVDFGVAKAAHRSIETLSGTVKGKISYMSPEQCKGASEIDRRSDLFSLGIVMWEVLTTEKLFRRNSDFETMQAIVSETVPPPSQLRPDIPPEIDHIVGRLLAKEPAQRYQTADELHEAIENVAVRTGSALSTASLGRYMRELFGQRPEPWIELAVADQHPEAFTVTSEPIPNNLAVSAADDFDRKLSAVPALTQRLTAPHDGARPPQPTVPLRVAAELVTTLPLGVDPQDLYKTQPIRDSASRIRGVLELQGDHPSSQPPAHPSGARAPTNQSGSMPMLPSQQNQIPAHAQATSMVRAGFTPDSGLLRPHSPSGTPHSSPHYPIATGASHQAFTGHAPSYPVAQRANQPAPARRSRALIIIVPAVIIGVVIGIALGFGGSNDKPAASADRDKPMPPAGTTTMVATVDKPAAPAATPAELPAAPAATSDKPADQPAAPTATADTSRNKPAASTATADTSRDKRTATAVNPATPTPEPAATQPSGAAPVTQPGVPVRVESTTGNVEAAIAMPEDKVAKKPKLEKPDVERLYKSGKYSEVVAACSAASQVVSGNAPLCTVSACKAKQAAKAKKWFAQVATAKKSSVVKDCDGVIAAEKAADKPPAPVDPCKTDPMACQH